LILGENCMQIIKHFRLLTPNLKCIRTELPFCNLIFFIPVSPLLS